jgi:glycosyltransferase involved in cell wall biosynthesis
MRILLLSPFAPDGQHRHAAADTIARLAPRLAATTELFVYSPQHGPRPPAGTPPPHETGPPPHETGPPQHETGPPQHETGPPQHETGPAPAAAAGSASLGYTALPASGGRPAAVLGRLGLVPGWLRQAWPREATREALEFANRLRPDVIHAEYLQTAEIVAQRRNVVLGLHDITESVMSESYRAATAGQRPYRLAELVRTRRFERAALRRAAAVVTLSGADLAVASRYNRHTLLARPGVEVGAAVWSPPPGADRPRLVFTGALWRRANVLAARYLAAEVMPLVWRALPGAELRIVGARPAPEVLALARAQPRIVVTGEVPDLREEMLRGHVVVAPSIVGGGVLMKVLHAMALGAPVVTSPAAAASVAGTESMMYIAATPEQVAAAVQRAVAAPAEAAGRGARARAHIASAFRWDDAVRTYLEAYAIAAEQGVRR